MRSLSRRRRARNGARLRPRRRPTPAPEPQTAWPSKTDAELALMREAGRIVAEVHASLREALEPDVSTWDLDQVAAQAIARHDDARSAFLGYRGFPAHTCISINEELVHGIPRQDRRLRSGDIVSIDVGVDHRGYIGDSAWTYAVGDIGDRARHLMQVTRASLFAGIQEAQPGNRLERVSRAVQRHVEKNRLHVVREYSSHGVGRQLHEEPVILNYVSPADPERNRPLPVGLVFALEPMVQVGTWRTRLLRDDWTVISGDRSLSAHFEHTVAVTEDGPEILTTL